uniref:site-specific DNA-methyltransferase (adenine-specific) n=1 Tax=Thermocrinis ruber TaxID=75906 RepID=A0A7C5X3T5_9AQUI
MKERIGFVETPREIAKLMVELASVGRDCAVLDVGCGRGVFLQVLKERGYENIYGIEMDEELFGYCRERFENVIWGDFLSYEFESLFDLIVGNPPYVHFSNLPEYLAKGVKEITKTGEGDIYYAFILRAISLLKEGGELIYIVPYHFFYNTHAQYLRETLLASGKIEIVIDLDEARLFRGENPETVIFKFKKGQYALEKEKIKVLRLRRARAKLLEIYTRAKQALEEKAGNDLFSYYEIPHFLHSQSWSVHVFIPSFSSPLKLKDLAKVGVGLVSGLERAFHVSEEELEDFTEKEKALVKKLIKAKNCKRFWTEGYELYILTNASVKGEEELKEHFPNIYRKLLAFKERLQNRYLPKGKSWFHWQALRNYRFLMQNLDKTRIYVPALDRHPQNRFSLGEGGLLPHGDVLFIQPCKDEDLLFLLGYLNSNLFREYYLSKGPRRGGRIAFTQKMLENAEVPILPESTKAQISEIVKEILSLKKLQHSSP